MHHQGSSCRFSFYFLDDVLVCVSRSVMSDSFHLLSTEFSRQEYWSGLPFPSTGHLPNPGIEPESPVSPALQADSSLLSQLGNPIHIYTFFYNNNFSVLAYNSSISVISGTVSIDFFKTYYELFQT